MSSEQRFPEERLHFIKHKGHAIYIDRLHALHG